VELIPGLRSRLRAARLHEDLRIPATARACREALGGDVVVLRGIALAYTVYDDPALRHCHDLDLLVRAGAGREQHEDGFPVSRHLSLFAPWRLGVGFDDVAADTVPTAVAGTAARVLPPAEAVVHTCAHAATLGIPHSPLWAVDAALLVRRTPELDWDRVAARARGWRCAGVVADALSWLRREVGVAVPAQCVRDLRTGGLSRLAQRVARRR
jgi:hypothetical protein